MNHAGFVIGSYAVTLGGIAAYVWYVLTRARHAAKRLPPEDRPWT